MFTFQLVGACWSKFATPRKLRENERKRQETETKILLLKDAKAPMFNPCSHHGTFQPMQIPISVLGHGVGLPLPAHASEEAAGLDIRAAISEGVVLLINPGEAALIPCGFQMELPVGYEAQVRPRSGLALKHSVTVLNSPGTIDSDYRGEVGVILINHGKNAFAVNRGDRIAQLVIARHERVEMVAGFGLSDSLRGANGFGSTGVTAS